MSEQKLVHILEQRNAETRELVNTSYVREDEYTVNQALDFIKAENQKASEEQAKLRDAHAAKDEAFVRSQMEAVVAEAAKRGDEPPAVDPASGDWKHLDVDYDTTVLLWEYAGKDYMDGKTVTTQL